jgi:hypothetical protein
MIKIQPLVMILLPAVFFGCQEIEGEKDTTLVYFFTDQDGSKVPLKSDNKKNEEKMDSPDEKKGFITRKTQEMEKSDKSKKNGLFSFFGGGDREEAKPVPSPKGDSAPMGQPAVAKSPVKSDLSLDAPAISEELQYPSIVEPEKAPEAKEAPLVKAYKVLDLGEEKIRVIDRQMGSVEAGDVKKLREQGSR